MPSYQVEDESGHVWQVDSGDPAAEYINILKRNHYRWYVLPRAAICGIMDLRGSHLPPRALPPRPSSAMLDRLPRMIRLWDCVETIQREAT